MPQRPNIVLLMTDQQRGDCLGCDGHPVVETPWLDHLARRGARFNHAYTPVPSCVPARMALMTGMSPWNCGHLGMRGGFNLEYPHTLAGELAAAGYHTQGVGKMHFSPQRKLMGFHHTILDESGRREGDFVSDYHRWFEEHKTGDYGYRDHAVDWNSWMARPSHLPEFLHCTAWTARQGIEFINRRDTTMPFFLKLSFARPHSPYDPPQPYWDMYIDAEIPKPAIGDWADVHDVPLDATDPNAWHGRRSEREIHRARAGYYGNITFIDHQIGLFIQALRKQGLHRNTWFLFTSDHGDMMGDHHLWRKTYAYEGSARIPFLVTPPEGADEPSGMVCDQPVQIQDIMPTILNIAGVPIPDSVDGATVLPLTRGESVPWREYVHGEHSACYSPTNEMQYVTDGREKFIWFPRTGQEQFFDLNRDPLEERDLIDDPASADRVRMWRQRLIDELAQRTDGLTDGEQLLVRSGPVVVHSPNHDKYVVPVE